MTPSDTPSDERMREIEAGERWLREAAPEVDTPDVDLIKMRARVALNEQWLTEQVRDEVPVGLADRIKRQLWVEAAGRTAQQQPADRASRVTPPTLLRLTKWACGMAAVAAVCVFAMRAFFPRPLQGPSTSEQINGFSYVAAFEMFDEQNEFTQRLALLEDDFQELESACGTQEYDDWEDTLIDEIGDDIERLLSEPSLVEEWS